MSAIAKEVTALLSGTVSDSFFNAYLAKQARGRIALSNLAEALGSRDLSAQVLDEEASRPLSRRQLRSAIKEMTRVEIIEFAENTLGVNLQDAIVVQEDSP